VHRSVGSMSPRGARSFSSEESESRARLGRLKHANLQEDNPGDVTRTLVPAKVAHASIRAACESNRSSLRTARHSLRTARQTPPTG